MLNGGFPGAGRIAGIHATAISTRPGSSHATVSDARPDAAETLARQYGTTARTTEDILADDTIHAVLISTSIDTHSDLIEAATAAGKASPAPNRCCSFWSATHPPKPPNGAPEPPPTPRAGRCR